MRNKNLIPILTLSFLFIFGGSGNVFGQWWSGSSSDEKPKISTSEDDDSMSFDTKLVPWSAKDLVSISKMTTDMKLGKLKNVYIFNVGPVDDIQRAENFGGAVFNEANMKNFEKRIASIPKNQEIIIYCGCCPMDVCPNIKDAYNKLMDKKYTNVKVLDIPKNLHDDWVSKGYPMKE